MLLRVSDTNRKSQCDTFLPKKTILLPSMSLSKDQIEQFQKAISAYQYKELIYAQDLILVPLYLLGIFFFLSYLKKKQPPEIRRYFLPGYYIRMAGIALFLIHHILIYTGGVDSFTYYWATNSMWEMFSINPSEVFKIIFTTTDLSDYTYPISEFLFMPNEAFSVRLFSVISFFCFNSYIVISLVAGLFAFGGCWKIFKIFHSLYPSHHKVLAVSTLFIPSVFFWSSVISKEILCIGAMGFLFDALYKFFIVKKNRVLHAAGILLFSYLLIRVKLYILMAFIPSLMVLLLLRWVKRLRSALLRKLAFPVILFVFGILSFLVLDTLGAALSQFALDKIMENIVTTYKYLTQEGFAESRYTLGEFSSTLSGVLNMAPAGINVTLFRPYVWEANKPITLLASLESTITLLITLFVVLKVGILRTLSKIGSDPILLFCLVFAMVFALAVGITSGNFGTLMRYKIPMMPFYFTGLAILYKTRNDANAMSSL